MSQGAQREALLLAWQTLEVVKLQVTFTQLHPLFVLGCGTRNPPSRANWVSTRGRVLRGSSARSKTWQYIVHRLFGVWSTTLQVICSLTATAV